MDSNKKIALGLAFGVGTLLVVIFLLVLSNREQTPIPKQPVIPTSIIIPTTAKETIPSIPSGSKINVDGVTIRNIYNDAVNINNEGDVQFSTDSGFHLVYLPDMREFLISIRRSPFTSVRIQAERDFLRALGINEEAACKLDVKITTPQFANPQEAGQVYSLSFCP